MTDQPKSGELIDHRYEVLDVLGRGSFGETLLAQDVQSDQRVAIKTLHPERADNLKAFEMFEREATVLRNLRHQGVPAILKSFTASWRGADTAFLVMEYVEGPTLAQLIERRHSFSTDDILTLLLDLAGILEYLHGRVPPILHRDIKPANVILRDHTPVVVDFGAVRNVFRAPGESGSTVVGTYGYMPYEQYMGQATPASDLYALGATMLHVLTGRPPSEFLTDQSRLEVPEQLPGGTRVRDILVKLLAPAAVDRIQSASELRRALLHTDATTGGLPAILSPSALTARKAETLLARLPPTPRALEGPTLEEYKKNVPSMWALMDTMAKPGSRPGAASIALLTFLSIVSVGVLPLVFGLVHAAHRRRIKPFFVNGQPAVGQIQKIELSGSAFGERMARVTYEFEADGMIHRGADDVLPRVADRWREGDAVALLAIPDQDYDSVIVSTS